MPASAIHMSVANIINKKLKQPSFEFTIGNIAPDCWRHSLLHNDKHLSHFSTDTEINGIKMKIENYEKFIEKYKNKLDDPFVLGYLTHLMTDNYWKKNVITRYQKLIDGEIALKTLDNNYIFGNIETIKEYLHINNEIATINISSHFNLKPITLDKKVKCIVEEIDLSGLIKSVEHINKVNFKKTDEKSIIYNMEDLYQDIIDPNSITEINNINHCGLGIGTWAIGVNGEIYGCQEQPSKEESNIFYIGDIYNGVDVNKHLKLLELFAFSEKPKCVDEKLCECCPITTPCKMFRLTCPSTMYDLRKDFYHTEKIECIWTQEIIKNCLCLMKILTEENNQYFQQFLQERCEYNDILFLENSKQKGGCI